jgi:hypothetical protein
MGSISIEGVTGSPDAVKYGRVVVRIVRGGGLRKVQREKEDA